MSRPFKLAILAPHVVQYHSPLFRALAKSRELQVTVYFLDTVGSDGSFDPSMNANVNWGPTITSGFSHEFLSNWSRWKAAPVVSRVNPSAITRIVSGGYDGVLVHGYDSLTSLMSVICAKMLGMKVLFRGEAVVRSSASVGVLKRAFKRMVVPLVLGASDIVFYSCEANREYFEQFGCCEKKLFALPCTVDNTYFQDRRRVSKNNIDVLRSRLQLTGQTKVLLSVGRFDGRKAQHHLVSATEVLQRRGRDVACVFVGDGPKRREVEELVQSRGIAAIHFVGFKSQVELSDYYELADVMCICSEEDPSPKVANESLNFALPIVSSDRVGTIGDLIIEGENGYVYPFGDLGALAECLERLVDDDGLRERFGSRSLQLCEHFSIETNVAAIEHAVLAVTEENC